MSLLSEQTIIDLLVRDIEHAAAKLDLATIGGVVLSQPALSRLAESIAALHATYSHHAAAHGDVPGLPEAPAAEPIGGRDGSAEQVGQPGNLQPGEPAGEEQRP